VVDGLGARQVATSDFSSVFVSPSVMIASDFSVGKKVELRPSASLNYSVAWLDGYTESGSDTSNLKVDSRKAKVGTSKVQLEGAYFLNEGSEVALRVGAYSRHTDDDQINASIGGNGFNYSTTADENVTGGFVGMHFVAVALNQFNIVADIEVGGADKEDYVNGFIGLEYVF
jgi:hypothetical protein